MKGYFEAFSFYTEWKYPEHINPKVQSRDLLKDPVYNFLESRGNWKWGYALCVGICLAFRALLWVAFGPIVAGASLLGGFLALNAPLILNIVCHLSQYGYKNFQIADNSMNNWFMAIVCVGDGWHNNHHAVPEFQQYGLETLGNRSVISGTARFKGSRAWFIRLTRHSPMPHHNWLEVKAEPARTISKTHRTKEREVSRVQ